MRARWLLLALPFAAVFYFHAGRYASTHSSSTPLPTLEQRTRIAALVAQVYALRSQNEKLQKENIMLHRAVSEASKLKSVVSKPSASDLFQGSQTESKLVAQHTSAERSDSFDGFFLMASEDVALPSGVHKERRLRALLGMSIALNRTLVLPSDVGDDARHLKCCVRTRAAREFGRPSELPESVRTSHVRVRVRREGEAGLLDDELGRALRAYKGTRLLEVEDAHAAFCGFALSRGAPSEREAARAASARYEEVVGALRAEASLVECTSSPKEAEVSGLLENRWLVTFLRASRRGGAERGPQPRGAGRALRTMSRGSRAAAAA